MGKERTNNLEGKWYRFYLELAGMVELKGWEEGFGDYFSREGLSPDVLSFSDFGEFSQGVWAFMLNPRADSRILTIDCSLGSTVFQATKLGGKTVSLQPNASLGRAVSRRLAGGNIQDALVVVGALDEDLPFRSGSFDLVCAHNLPRIFSTQQGDFRTPSRFIGNISRLVRDGGALYLSGSAARVSQCEERKRPSDILKILRELRRIGWDIDLIFEFYKNLRNPDLLRVRFLSGKRPSLRSRMWLSMRPKNYGIVAHRKRDDRLRVPINRWITGRQSLNGRVTDGVRIVHVGSRGVLRIESQDQIFRFPGIPDGVQSCQRNFEALKYLAEKKFIFRTPLPGESALKPIPYFAEERLPGKTIDYQNASRRDLRHYNEEGIRVLRSLHGGATDLREMDEALYREYFEEKFPHLLLSLPESEKRRFLRANARMKDRVQGNMVPMSLGHGDFKVTNFLVDSRNRVTALIDWDRFERSSPVIVDFIWLLSYNLGIQMNAPWTHSILALSKDTGYSSMLRSYAESYGADPSLLKLYSLMTMVHYLKFIDRHFLRTPQIRKVFVSPFLAEFERYADFGEAVSG